MKKFAKSQVARVIICVLTIGLTFAGCSMTEEQLTNIGKYDGCTLELTGGEAKTSDTGKTVLNVSATYTNDNEDPLYALCSFSVKAFQNDVEIEDISDINGDEATLIKEVKDGQSISVNYVFELSDDSPVEVFICTPTADEEIIAKVVYLENESGSETE